MFDSKKVATSVALAVIGAMGLAVGGAAATVYTVNETITGPLDGTPGNPSQTDSVVGSITTDGTIGVLDASNILGWNLDLIDVTTPANSIDLTPSNSSISVDFGSVLSASSTGLSFDFSGTGAIAFQANNPGPASGFHYWCLSANYYGCLTGNSIAPGNVYDYPGNTANDLVVAGQTGTSPLNQGGAPEPATWAMMLLGLGGLGAALRARRRTIVAA